jgi:hypothetical protein
MGYDACVLPQVRFAREGRFGVWWVAGMGYDACVLPQVRFAHEGRFCVLVGCGDGLRCLHFATGTFRTRGRIWCTCGPCLWTPVGVVGGRGRGRESGRGRGGWAAFLLKSYTIRQSLQEL